MNSSDFHACVPVPGVAHQHHIELLVVPLRTVGVGLCTPRRTERHESDVGGLETSDDEFASSIMCLRVRALFKFLQAPIISCSQPAVLSQPMMGSKKNKNNPLNFHLLNEQIRSTEVYIYVEALVDCLLSSLLIKPFNDGWLPGCVAGSWHLIPNEKPW